MAEAQTSHGGRREGSGRKPVYPEDMHQTVRRLARQEAKERGVKTIEVLKEWKAV